MTSAQPTAAANVHAFPTEERDAVYRAIFGRRDVRGQFLPTPIPSDVLARILTAAHHAPSVGFMQPWNFIIVQSLETKRRVHDAFASANEEAAGLFSDDRQAQYRKLKLEGILESPIGLCVTCDRERSGPIVIGRTHMKSMDLYSSACAIQNLWLAARAEGLGVGWVSIFSPPDLQAALGIPESVVPMGYLCLGYVSYFHVRPELESTGWLPRLPLRDLLYFDHWAETADHPVLGHLSAAESVAQQFADRTDRTC